MRSRAFVLHCGTASLIMMLGCTSLLGLDGDFERAFEGQGGAIAASSAGSAGSGGEADGGVLCEPEVEEPCFSGPPETKGVGACRAGAKVCDQDGAGYSACAGEVPPACEDCGSAEDESCDGAGTCSGKHTWSRRFGDSVAQQATAVASEATGGAVIAGYFYGSIEFAHGPEKSDGLSDIFLEKLDSSGAPIWGRRFGDASFQVAQAIAVDDSGNITLAGQFGGTLDFGGVALESADSSDVFVARFDASGKHVWSERFGGAGEQSGAGVALDKQGNIILCGYFQGDLDFKGAPLMSADGYDGFAVKLDPYGGVVWSRRYGGPGNQFLKGVAVDASGAVLLAGAFDGSIELDPQIVRTSAGGADVVVIKIDADGQPIWSKTCGDSMDQMATSIAVDSENNVLVVGSIVGSMSCGASITATGAEDVFVAKFDDGGSHLWVKAFGGKAAERSSAVDVDVDCSGNPLVVGTFDGTLDFGGGPMEVVGGGKSAFAAKLDRDGDHVWSRSFNGPGDQSPYAVAAARLGSAFVVGAFESTIDFGGEALESSGSSDVFVVKLSP